MANTELILKVHGDRFATVHKIEGGSKGADFDEQVVGFLGDTFITPRDVLRPLLRGLSRVYDLLVDRSSQPEELYLDPHRTAALYSFHM